MITEFAQLNLHPQLIQAVTEQGFLAPMPIQSALIPIMLTGQDVIGQAQTGTGKTAAFALPILQNLAPGHAHIQALILAPTRELAIQVAEATAEFGRFQNVRVVTVYGGQPYGPQIAQIKRGADIVVGTPGRIMDLIERKLLDFSHVHTVVLDEADEMLSMGFVDDIETILAEVPETRQTALFSATLPPEIRRIAGKYMRDPQSISIKSEQVTVDTIEQRYYLVNSSDKLAALTRLFEMEAITSVLVFARTRAGTGELSNELTARGFPAEALNGDLSQEAREHTLNRFRQNKISVLVATDVAARGLDIDNISHVFNYDLPDDPELYVHRIGRTGRAGKTGIAITLVCPFERRDLREIEAFAHVKLTRATLPTAEDIRTSREEGLVNQVKVWLQRGRCRREREIVDKLVAEGFDPLEVAAAALKVGRAEEKQRPIYSVTEIVDKPRYSTHESSQGRGGSSERFDRFSNTSHEAGMVRLSLNVGKKQGIRPNDIVGAIAAHANIPGSTIGKIHIQERLTLVDVPEQFVAQVLGKGHDFFIRRIPIDLQRA